MSYLVRKINNFRTLYEKSTIFLHCTKNQWFSYIVRKTNNFRTLYEKLTIFVLSTKIHKFRTLYEKSMILKIALNHVLMLRPDRARNFEVTRPKIMDFQTKNIIFMKKHWNYRISVPMSYISFLYAYNMTQILYCGGGCVGGCVGNVRVISL